MEFQDYQDLALRTVSKRSLETEKDMINTGVLGLCGEAGEVADHLKKGLFHDHIVSKDFLAKEVGDVLWYCAILAEGLGLSLDTIAEQNIAKLRQRYPEGFSTERSLNRESEVNTGGRARDTTPTSERPKEDINLPAIGDPNDR